MKTILDEVCTSLDDLSASIIKSYPNDQTMTELWGWNFPPLNRYDIANLADKISSKVKEHNFTSIDDSLRESLENIKERIKIFKFHTLPYLFNGNGSSAMVAYLSLIDWITLTLSPLFNWEVLQENKALPNQLSRRLRSIQSEINDIVPEKEELEKQIKLIKDATEAAESLPTDLEKLKEARKKVDKFSTDAAELYGKIDTYYKESDKTSKNITDKKTEADLLVSQCEEAYRITTTKGLAASFEQRANRLSITMWIWVLGLLASLVAGGIIGASRFETLAESLQKPNLHWGVIWMDFILSVIGLAAPIWFSWLATKQINQIFRLAEDYAYKASVAKAYEGYRREAAKIDVAFEARLFSSALSRLEEAPLRFVKDDYHSSPWQELLNSPGFIKALNKIPELKNKFIEISKKEKIDLETTEDD